METKRKPTNNKANYKSSTQSNHRYKSVTNSPQHQQSMFHKSGHTSSTTTIAQHKSKPCQTTCPKPSLFKPNQNIKSQKQPWIQRPTQNRNNQNPQTPDAKSITNNPLSQTESKTLTLQRILAEPHTAGPAEAPTSHKASHKSETRLKSREEGM